MAPTTVEVRSSSASFLGAEVFNSCFHVLGAENTSALRPCCVWALETSFEAPQYKVQPLQLETLQPFGCPTIGVCRGSPLLPHLAEQQEGRGRNQVVQTSSLVLHQLL